MWHENSFGLLSFCLGSSVKAAGLLETSVILPLKIKANKNQDIYKCEYVEQKEPAIIKNENENLKLFSMWYCPE